MTVFAYPSVERPKDAEHVTLYYDTGHFAGWPFNHGFWAFSENELLVSFSRGPCSYETYYDMGHSVVDALGGEYVTLRSTDGGRSWPLDGLQSLGTRQAIEKPLFTERDYKPERPFDWNSPDFCLTAGFGIPPERRKEFGYIQVSHDRGAYLDSPLFDAGLWIFVGAGEARLSRATGWPGCCCLLPSVSAMVDPAADLWRFMPRLTRG